MSQRAYARHRAEKGLPGTTHRAVQKAVEAGRITLTADGLIDPRVADKAWEANSAAGHRRNEKQAEAAKAKKKPTAKQAPEKQAPAKKPAAKKKAAPAPPPSPPSPPPRPPPPPPFEDEEHLTASPGMSLAEASAIEKFWKAKLAELEYEERSGQLVRAEEVAARWAEIITISKTKILAVSAKAKGRIPRLTAADVGVLDTLIREALEELAETDLEEGGGDGS